eukprot:m.101882 g.101882  ORF g.101882 m.101882 type:complete len:73 (+) comp13210_c1_seq1:440-658(+)
MSYRTVLHNALFVYIKTECVKNIPVARTCWEPGDDLICLFVSATLITAAAAAQVSPHSNSSTFVYLDAIKSQ